MATLFPSDFDLDSLRAAEAEWRIVQHFLSTLDDSWMVIPSVQVTDEGQDGEIDCVLVSFDHGVFTVEVKGGIVTLDKGKWKSNERPMRDPVAQVVKNRHLLVERLKKSNADLTNVYVQHLVAFPDNADFPESGAGVEFPRERILTRTELPHLEHFLAHLCRGHQPVREDQIRHILKELRPDVPEIRVDGRYVTGMSQRISKTAGDRLSFLFDADVNRRILVRGPAGTGKTFLAKRWTERALQRGEATLLVCYNRFLGWDLVRQMRDAHDRLERPPLLRVGSFHAVVNEILGDLKPTVPNEPDQSWWETAHRDALRDNLASINDRFDTIIIDEGQDFSEEWLNALRGLLRDPDAGRFYILGDEAQAIFRTTQPTHEGFFVLPLTANVRSTKEIARTLGVFGGAETLETAPPGPRVDFHVVRGGKERTKVLVKTLHKIRGEMAIPPSHVMVVVPHRQDREDLVGLDLGDGISLCTWETRDEVSIPCGTIQGTKGLERTAVVLVSLDEEPDPTLTYIGASRAGAYLAVIGRQALIDQFTGPTV